MNDIPVWLKVLEAFATIISSVGVIIALVQLRASSSQFNTQLGLTEHQFKLLNQGYINLTFNLTLYVKGEDGKYYPGDMVPDNDGIFYKSSISTTLENVGNMPIRLDMRHCIIYSNGEEIYRTPESVFTQTQNTIYPTATMPYGFGIFSLHEKGVNLSQLADMNITCELLIEYYDFDKPDHIKKIDRSLALEYNQITIKNNRDVI